MGQREDRPANLQGLLAAVKADPADDGVRLVLADWLEEHGQPARAEFIRVQVGLGRLDRAWPGLWHARGIQRDWLIRERARLRDRDRFAGQRAALAERERDLLAAHGDEWAGGVPWGPNRYAGGPTVTCEFVRGLPVVEGCYRRFHHHQGPRTPAHRPPLAVLAELAAAGVLDWAEEVRLCPDAHGQGEDDWRAIGGDPALGLVTHLHFEGDWFGWQVEPVLRGLAGSPHLGGLRWLDASVEQIGGPVEALRVLPVPGLRFLRLAAWEEGGGPIAEWLATDDPLPRLEELDLSGADLLRALDPSPAARRYAPGPAVDVQALVLSAAFSRLRRLIVSGDVWAAGLLALVESPHLPGPLRIDCDQTRWADHNLPDPDFISRLAACPGAARLRSLDVRGAAAPGAGMREVAGVLLSSPHLAGLEVVRIDADLRADLLERLARRFPLVLP